MGTTKKIAPFQFSFDKIFDQYSSQQDIFEETAPLVQSALDGYNVAFSHMVKQVRAKKSGVDENEQNERQICNIVI